MDPYTGMHALLVGGRPAAGTPLYGAGPLLSGRQQLSAVRQHITASQLQTVEDVERILTAASKAPAYV